MSEGKRVYHFATMLPHHQRGRPKTLKNNLKHPTLLGVFVLVAAFNSKIRNLAIAGMNDISIYLFFQLAFLILSVVVGIISRIGKITRTSKWILYIHFLFNAFSSFGFLYINGFVLGRAVTLVLINVIAFSLGKFYAFLVEKISSAKR